MRYVFANCEFDTQGCILRRSGQDVPLRPKVFRLLVYLLSSAIGWSQTMDLARMEGAVCERRHGGKRHQIGTTSRG